MGNNYDLTKLKVFQKCLFICAVKFPNLNFHNANLKNYLSLEYKRKSEKEI